MKDVHLSSSWFFTLVGVALMVNETLFADTIDSV